MALTPEDVLNKNFTATQFRRGYDEQEVDDFLDEVVGELRRLIAENAELRQRLEATGGDTSNLPAPVVPDTSQEDLAQVRAQADAAALEAQERIVKAKAEAEQAEREAQERVAAASAQAEQAEAEAAARVEQARNAAAEGAPVSYTHLTLPTNREV